MRARGRRGSTLLETVLAMVILAAAGLAVVAMMQKAIIASQKAREKMTCQRMAQTGMARLKNINYYYLFAVDSSLPNWASPALHAGYPYTAVLNGILTTLQTSRFDRFKVNVTFMRRDTTDALGTGNTSNLIAFADNGGGVDKYDPNVKFDDQNGDGDDYETYTSGGRTISEQPDTHLKLVNFSVYRSGRLVCGTTELISLEQFTGVTNPDSESSLTLEVSTPSNNGNLYQEITSGQIGARGLALTLGYPSSVMNARADGGSPLSISGVTAPLATVNFYVGGSGILDSAVADVNGNFAVNSPLVTSALAEGKNTLRAQAVKSSFTSPYANRTVILDVAPPVISSRTPSGTVSTYAPAVYALLSDPVTSTSAVPSGICPSVITMKVNGAAQNFSYDPVSGRVTLAGASGQTWLVLPAGVSTVTVETGDYAGFKASATWTFNVSVPATDNSAPSIANKSPIGGSAGSDLPQISAQVFDSQSGIDPSSVVMTVDGAVVPASYDPDSGTVSYVPSAPFSPGSTHVVSMSANHWATNPPDKINSTDNWSFVVP